jgi:hypothetical protein
LKVLLNKFKKEYLRRKKYWEIDPAEEIPDTPPWPRTKIALKFDNLTIKLELLLKCLIIKNCVHRRKHVLNDKHFFAFYYLFWKNMIIKVSIFIVILLSIFTSRNMRPITKFSFSSGPISSRMIIILDR